MVRVWEVEWKDRGQVVKVQRIVAHSLMDACGKATSPSPVARITGARLLVEAED